MDWIDSMCEVVIKGGRVVDGTGNPWFKADVGIEDGKITRVSRVPIEEGGKIINADGLVIAPGFINMHCHTDSSIFFHPSCASSMMMGVTTEFAGACGKSTHTITPDYKEVIKKQIIRYAPSFEEGEAFKVDWTNLAEWRRRLEGRGIGINLATAVGINTVRECAMGREGSRKRFRATEDEMEAMKSLVAQGMENGSFGVSINLTGQNITTREIIELCEVSARYGGVYDCHLRSEAYNLIEAVREFIAVCEMTPLRGNINHHKVWLKTNFGKVNETVRLLNEARAQGVDLMVDQYPWTMACAVPLGNWFVRGSTLSERLHGSRLGLTKTKEEIMEEVRNPQTWQEIKDDIQATVEGEAAAYEARRREFEKEGIAVGRSWDPQLIQSISWSGAHPELFKMNFAEAAEHLGFDDYREAIRKIWLDDDGETMIGGGIMHEMDVQHIMKQPWTAPSTDGAALDFQPAWYVQAHPRNYGSFSKIFEFYVNEVGLLTLEEAVRRVTGLPANFLGLQDRGYIKEGMWADITVFDPVNIHTTSLWGPVEKVRRHPKGMPYVLVNGVLVKDEDKMTGALPGKVLFHEA